MGKKTKQGRLGTASRHARAVLRGKHYKPKQPHHIEEAELDPASRMEQRICLARAELAACEALFLEARAKHRALQDQGMAGVVQAAEELQFRAARFRAAQQAVSALLRGTSNLLPWS